MLEFELPWLLLLLPLPIVVRYLLPSYGSNRPALKVPFMAAIEMASAQPAEQQKVVLRRRWWQRLLLLSLWLLLLMAVAKPVWLGPPIEIKTPSRDLMVAVDLSGSMSEEDFAAKGQETLSRLDGAKQVLAAFAQQREGDRLGLMVFADAPFLQMPFSDDSDLFRRLLEQSQVRMAGAKTMLGDAIGFAYKHFIATVEEHDSNGAKPQRLLLLLTDGNDSGSKIPPLEAAVLAAQQHIKIYPVVLGDPLAGGEKAIDEESLKTIANITGGRFYRASDTQALEKISAELNRLEPSKYSISYYRPSRELYYWPLLLALLFAQLGHGGLALRHLWLRRKNTRSGARETDVRAGL